MKVLFTTPILEHPPAGGPTLRIENSIKALSRVCELHVVSRVRQKNIGGKVAKDFYKGLSKTFRYSPSSNPILTNRYARKVRGRFDWLNDFDTRRDVSFLLGVVDKHDIDVLWFGYGNISFDLMAAVRKARPGLKLVCDTDSVWSRFVLRELPYITDDKRRQAVEKEGRAKEGEEKLWVDFCNVTTGVSDIDVAYYRSIAADPLRVYRFSNVIDLESYELRPPPPSDFRRPCMYLAGTFGHPDSPMDVAARWVSNEILPLVKAAIPDIHFYIVGTGSENTLGDSKDPAITATGKLPSVLPYLCNADVALVPLKFESGTRFKILEAAACRVPIVSTSLGAEGLPVIDGEHVLIADTAARFAEAVTQVINNQPLGKHLGHNCNDLIRQNFSIEYHTKEASLILDYLNQ